MTRTAEKVASEYDLNGHNVVITGCNSGIGFETARVLANRGARIIGLARNREKAQHALSDFNNDPIPVACDLSSIAGVRKATEAITQELDIIIANAGVMALQKKTLINNIEAHFFVNHLAHFELVTQLLPQLKPGGRVIVVASAAHTFSRKPIDLSDLSWSKRAYKPWVAYGQSKLANILFTKELATRLPANQTANCLHPGIIDSNLWRHVPNDRLKYVLKGVEYGAATSVMLAVSDKFNEVTGEYFSGGKQGTPSSFAQDTKAASDLWYASEEILRTYK